MKRKTLIVLFVVLVGVVGAGLVFVPIARERARRARCLAPLHCCFRKAIAMYAMDHNGAFPTSITEIACYADNVKLYICPSSGTKSTASRVRDLTNWMDYIYIHWPDGEKTPANYPWIYDRRLSHHGDGIHVAPIAGPAFWDEGAQWLQKFAKEHSELEIPMPEDLK